MVMLQGSVAERALGYQQLLAGEVDVGTGLVIPDGTATVIVVVEGQSVRWRDDGIAPTATIGMPATAGTTLRFDSQALKALRFISQTAGAILNVSYYGP